MGEERAGEEEFEESANGRTRGVGRRLLEFEGKIQFEDKMGIGLEGSGRGPRRE